MCTNAQTAGRNWTDAHPRCVHDRDVGSLRVMSRRWVSLMVAILKGLVRAVLGILFDASADVGEWAIGLRAGK